MDLRLGRLSALLLTLSALPTSVHAHTSARGSSDVMNGVLHPLITPSHLLILFGLGISLGQQLPLRLAIVVRLFMPLSAMGLLLTMSWSPIIPHAVLICFALGAAILVVVEARLSEVSARILFAFAAITIALDSGVKSGAAPTALKTLLGTWLILQVLLLNIAYYVSLVAAKKQKSMSIGLRVIGSWIAAISLLVLAFALRK